LQNRPFNVVNVGKNIIILNFFYNCNNFLYNI